MKQFLSIFTIAIFLLLILPHCTSPSSKHNEKQSNSTLEISETTPPSDFEATFPLPDIPVMLTDPQEETNYLAKHYWDLFPFDDTSLIVQPEITEQGLVDYIQLLNSIPNAHAENSLQIMLNKAKVEPTMYSHFASLFEKYLYDPNSPFRNDELYIPVVENLLQSGLLSETKQEIYNFQHEMILKNRRGTTATDFVYTLANGDKGNMHDLQSNYLIVFITNPDCPTCAQVTQAMSESTVLRDIFSLNNSYTKMLTVLNLYPDSNIEEWRKALPNMPQKNWVNAYDEGTIMTSKRLYDIKAIPTLYLLDKNKQIILKDTSLEEIEMFFMKVR